MGGRKQVLSLGDVRVGDCVIVLRAEVVSNLRNGGHSISAHQAADNARDGWQSLGVADVGAKHHCTLALSEVLLEPAGSTVAAGSPVVQVLVRTAVLRVDLESHAAKEKVSIVSDF